MVVKEECFLDLGRWLDRPSVILACEPMVWHRAVIGLASCGEMGPLREALAYARRNVGQLLGGQLVDMIFLLDLDRGHEGWGGVGGWRGLIDAFLSFVLSVDCLSDDQIDALLVCADLIAEEGCYFGAERLRELADYHYHSRLRSFQASRALGHTGCRSLRQSGADLPCSVCIEQLIEERSVFDGYPFDRPFAGYQRYHIDKVEPWYDLWSHRVQRAVLCKGRRLRCLTEEGGFIRYSCDGWHSYRDVLLRAFHVNRYFADLELEHLHIGSTVEFTFFYSGRLQWEGGNFILRVF